VRQAEVSLQLFFVMTAAYTPFVAGMNTGLLAPEIAVFVMQLTH